jgi:citrate lyase alpha subunit
MCRLVERRHTSRVDGGLTVHFQHHYVSGNRLLQLLLKIVNARPFFLLHFLLSKSSIHAYYYQI